MPAIVQVLLCVLGGRLEDEDDDGYLDDMAGSIRRYYNYKAGLIPVVWTILLLFQ